MKRYIEKVPAEQQPSFRLSYERSAENIDTIL